MRNKQVDLLHAPLKRHELAGAYPLYFRFPVREFDFVLVALYECFEDGHPVKGGTSVRFEHATDY